MAYASRSSATSYIGKRSGTASQQTPFNGKIYCIRIYNRQLSETESVCLANFDTDEDGNIPA